MTPNIGLGGNSSMESVAVLCNHLQQMMVDQCGAKPSLATLNKVFAAYQTETQARVKSIMDFSSLITNVQAWRNPLYKLMANWVLPLQSDRALADQLGEIIRAAPKLNFVDVADFPSGRLPWTDEDYQAEKQNKKKKKKQQKNETLSRRSYNWALAHLMRCII